MERESKNGYSFETDGNVEIKELTLMVTDIKIDTESWKAEGTKHYSDSKVYTRRHCYGGTFKRTQD